MSAEIDAIVARVAVEHGSCRKDVLSGCRLPSVVKARRAVIRAVAEARPTWDLSRVGRALGVTHTTVGVALGRYKEKGAR